MNTNILGFIISAIYMLSVFGIAYALSGKGKEFTRKFIHIMLGNWWIIAALCFDDVKYAVILPALFVVVNYLSHKYKLIKMMERDSSDVGEGKDTYGTVFYAVSLLVLVLYTYLLKKMPMLGLTGIFTMAYGDGLAAVFGTKFGKKKILKNSNKSVVGTTVMFVVTFIIHLVFFMVYGVKYAILKAILMALIASVIELFAKRGTDNLFVPIVTTIVAGFLM